MVINKFEDQSSQEQLIASYMSRALDSMEGLSREEVIELLSLLAKARESESTVFIAGNGGSASTAAHIALDWMLGAGLSNPPLRVVNIAESSASITATGNDISFERVFSRQLSSLAKFGDLLVVISASGNSRNLVELATVAKSVGVKLVAMTGFDGGRLAQMADLSVHVPTAIGDYGVAEDIHLMIGHIVKEALIAGDGRDI